MSRHRIVRKMNYDEERYVDDDDFGHSYEDRYCISPSTAAQFTYDRDRDLSLSSYMGDEIPEEAEMELEPHEAPAAAAPSHAVLRLTDIERAQLQSCKEEVHNIMGDNIQDAAVEEAILRHRFNVESAIDELLSSSDVPKAQRTQRKRRERTQGAADNAVSTTSHTEPQQEKQQLKETPHPAAPRLPVVTVTTPKREVRKGFDVRSDNSHLQQQQNGEPGADRMSQEMAAMGLEMDAGVVGVGDAKTKNASLPSTMDGESKTSESPSLPRQEGVLPHRLLEHAPMGVPKSGSKSKLDKIDAKAEYAKRKGNQELINLVVIGHVDAGKSTLMGHVLYNLGVVQQRTMHKYEQESRKIGKSSFAFAWVLDETDEERSRGVTMDVAQTRFTTDKKVVMLLDAPGHKDFIPNMITGAAQADVAILVINATRGEFETGFDAGGQTREHALLARSLGVSQIIVAVNKMDTVDWGQARYDEICKKLGQFLRQVGFKDADLSFIPCSGLVGENLTSPSSEPRLTAWYSGATLVQQIDLFKNPERPVDKPFRLSVSDVFKSATGGFSIAGQINAGYIRPGDKVMVMPAAILAGVKSVMVDDLPFQIAFAGDRASFTLTNIDMSSVQVGFVLCDPLFPTHCATRIRAKIVVFNLEMPITRGFPVVFHYQSIAEPAIIKKLVSSLNKSSGEVIKSRPKCLTKNSSAIVELEFERATCVELYSEYRDLGRFMLRSSGHTVAAGLIEEILQTKVRRDEQKKSDLFNN